jgi:hypothetical protein
MNPDLTYDGRIPAVTREHMEPHLDINDLGIAFSKLAEALAVEMNWPITRRYTHAELADSFRAIRQVNAEREEK